MEQKIQVNMEKQEVKATKKGFNWKKYVLTAVALFFVLWAVFAGIGYYQIYKLRQQYNLNKLCGYELGTMAPSFKAELRVQDALTKSSIILGDTKSDQKPQQKPVKTYYIEQVDPSEQIFPTSDIALITNNKGIIWKIQLFKAFLTEVDAQDTILIVGQYLDQLKMLYPDLQEDIRNHGTIIERILTDPKTGRMVYGIVQNEPYQTVKVYLTLEDPSLEN